MRHHRRAGKSHRPTRAAEPRRTNPAVGILPCCALDPAMPSGFRTDDDRSTSRLARLSETATCHICAAAAGRGRGVGDE